MTQNDVMQLMINLDNSAAPSVSAGSAINTYTQLYDGELAVVNPHNIVLNASTVLTDDLVAVHGLKVIGRQGTKLLSSDLIKQNNIVSFKSETGSVAAEQITYIGYNTTTNSIDVNNSALYVTRLTLKERDITGFGQTLILNAPYKSDATATQPEVACGIALALSNLLRRQATPPIKAELICDRASTVANGFDNTGTVVNGSKVFSLLVSVNYAAGTPAVAGDFVRFAATTSSTGTTVTDGIYKIVSISGLNVTVDRPIEAPSGSYTDTENEALVIPVASAAVAKFGIKLTGIARTFSLPKFRYSKVEFEVGLDSDSSYEDTVVTYTTPMSLGAGTYQQIAQLEWDLLGNEGNEYRGDFLYTAQRAQANSAKTYSTASLGYFADPQSEAIGGQVRRQKQLVLAFEKGFLTTEAPDIVLDCLVAYTTMTSEATV